MQTVYACTRISKEVSDWTKDGAGIGRRCIFDNPENIVADSLPELVKLIEEKLFAKIDSLWFPGVDDGDEDTRVSFNRIENGDAEEPTEGELIELDAGQRSLYLADYDLLIEKRSVSPVTREELTAAGIKTHE